MVSWQCPMEAQLSPHESVCVAPIVDGFFLHPLSAALCSFSIPLLSILLRATVHLPFSGATQGHSEVPNVVVKVVISAHQVVKFIK